jgi:hypothetical protein
LGRFELLSDDAAARVGQAFAIPLPQGLFLVDQDLDGRPDRVFDASATLAPEHAMPRQGVFLLTVAGRSAVLTALGAVEPVERRTATVLGDEAGEAVRSVTVQILNKGGWIVASLDDPYPGLPVLAVVRSDGSELPAEAVWRDGRTLRFLDDPDTTYRILYDNAGRSGDGAGSAGGHWLPSWALWVAVGVAGMLAGIAVTLLAVRRRA